MDSDTAPGTAPDTDRTAAAADDAGWPAETMAGGILVDALIIRMCIVPATMQLIGKANWWFPTWLDRALPHIGVEQTGGPELTVATVATDPATAAATSGTSTP